jgi:hypothetical protein
MGQIGSAGTIQEPPPAFNPKPLIGL